MGRLANWVGLTALALLILVGVQGCVFLRVAGFFTEVIPVSRGACTIIAAAHGGEDLEIDRARNAIFISDLDARAAQSGKPSTEDGIYLLSLADKSSRKLAGTDANFHPHGISLYPGRNARVLMAINHAVPNSSTVEIFDIVDGAAGLSLRHRKSVSAPVFTLLNDIVALDGERFYAVNFHRAPEMSLVDLLLVRPTANVVLYDGARVRVAAKGQRGNAGIALSPDGSKLYVAEFFGRRLTTFTRDSATGDLTRLSSLKIPSALDNIDRDEHGGLWIAVHPKALRLLKFAKDPAKPTPSQIWRIAMTGDLPAAAELFYGDEGEGLGAATIGAVMDGHLFMSSIWDTRILDCALAPAHRPGGS